MRSLGTPARMLALALALAAAAPSAASAQSTREIRYPVPAAAEEAIAMPIGLLGAMLVGALDLYIVGLAVDRACREGNGFEGLIGVIEILAGGGFHFFLGGMLTYAGTYDATYLAVGVPALAFGAFYVVHGIYSLADPSPRSRPSARPAVVPRAGGATFELAGTF